MLAASDFAVQKSEKVQRNDIAPQPDVELERQLRLRSAIILATLPLISSHIRAVECIKSLHTIV